MYHVILTLIDSVSISWVIFVKLPWRFLKRNYVYTNLNKHIKFKFLVLIQILSSGLDLTLWIDLVKTFATN